MAGFRTCLEQTGLTDGLPVQHTEIKASGRTPHFVV